jgi:hypothetical protein
MSNDQIKEIQVMTKSNFVSKFAKRVSMVVVAAAMIVIVASATGALSDEAQAAGMRPFKGSASGIFTGPDSGTGTVTATHIGKGDVVFTGLILDFGSPTPDGPNVCFPVTGGNQKFTAANGDEIETNYDSGRFCVDPSTGAPVYGNFVTSIINGSGRFDGAIGSVLIDAVATEEGWTSTFTEGSWTQY